MTFRLLRDVLHRRASEDCDKIPVQDCSTLFYTQWSPVLQRVDGAGFSKEGGRGLDVIVAVHHGDDALRDHLRGVADSYSWECSSMKFQRWAVR
jgi:hypothetical protein